MSDKHAKYMQMARTVGEQFSKDRSRKVGAIFIGEHGQPLTWGYNGFPRGANDNVEARHERPLKYQWSEHAERNAIYNATRSGICLMNSKVYITTLPPCIDCARALIQVGVKEVYIEDKALLTESGMVRKDWTETLPIIREMFDECGVKLFVLPQFENQPKSWYK